VHPCGGERLDVGQAPQRAGAERGIVADRFGFVQADGGLGEALSKASPTEPIEATNPDKARVSPNRTDVYCAPASLLSRIRLNADLVIITVMNSVAVEHAMIIAAYTMLSSGEFYRDPGADYYTARHPARTKARALSQLESLGYTVTLEPHTGAA